MTTYLINITIKLQTYYQSIKQVQVNIQLDKWVLIIKRLKYNTCSDPLI